MAPRRLAFVTSHHVRRRRHGGQPRIWSRQFTCAALVNFFTCLNFFMLVPVTVLLTVEWYDASLGLGGAVAGALLVGAVSARPLAGLLMAALTPRTLLMCSTAGMTVATALCLLPLDLVTFTVLRFASGFAFGLGSTATLAVAVSSAPAERRGEATGNFGLSNSLSGAVGPAAGLYVANQVGYDEVVLMVCACAFFGFVAAAALRRTPEERPDPDLPSARGLRRFFEPRVLPLCAVIALVGLAYSSVFGFLDAWSVELELTDWAPWFFVSYSVMVLLVRPPTGRLLDRHGPLPVLLPGMLAMALSMVLVSTMSGPGGMILAGVVCGFGMGVILCGATVIAVTMAPPGRMPVTASTFYMFLDGAVAGGPMLLGLLIPHTGYANLYLSLAFVTLGTATLFTVLEKSGRFTAPRRPSAAVTVARQSSALRPGTDEAPA